MADNNFIVQEHDGVPHVVAYSHGSSLLSMGDDGGAHPSAVGCGVFFGKDNPLNSSWNFYGGCHSNQCGEILAAKAALEQAKNHSDYKCIEIRTDSENVIKGVQDLTSKKKCTPWKPPKEEEEKSVACKPAYSELFKEMGHFDSVKFTHVPEDSKDEGYRQACDLSYQAFLDPADDEDPETVRFSEEDPVDYFHDQREEFQQQQEFDHDEEEEEEEEGDDSYQEDDGDMDDYCASEDMLYADEIRLDRGYECECECEAPIGAGNDFNDDDEEYGGAFHRNVHKEGAAGYVDSDVTSDTGDQSSDDVEAGVAGGVQQ